jgi:putative CocE/NonD family hydrolase
MTRKPGSEKQYEVRLRRNVLMPLPGGVELAADLYLPDAPGPFPALVSFYPYRKDDVKGANGEFAIRYFVERGYAHVLADFRGLGNSSGVSSEAMSYDEAADGSALVEWIASQPWCDGNVGMWGVSYGGITSFQTASARPPHLRAIVPIFASFDIYNDWFYPGGCFNCLGIGTWASQMLAMQLAPPMCHDTEGRWYEVWRARLEESQPYILPWLDHPERDEFWRAKAIPLELIDVPTFLIGGWRDLFPEAMTRAYEQIQAPRKLWMGPWLHVAPDSSRIVPVEYLPEMCRWFDRFMREERNGIEEEPPVTLYVQGEGDWKHEREWPIARTQERTFYLAAGSALLDAPPETEQSIPYVTDPTVGVQAGLWDPKGTGLGLPLDQRPDDDRSLSFTSEPLLETLEISGSPEATLTAAVEEGKDTNLVVKLCDVAPDGFSTLVTSGWLKGSHRFSHERPEPLPDDELVDVPVPLWATSYRLAAGHRLRVSVSCSDFPRIWPTRTNPRIRLATGGEHRSSIRLPVVPSGGAEGPTPTPADPTTNRARLTHESAPVWRIERDIAAGATSVVLGDRSVMTTPGRDGKVVFDQLVRATVTVDTPGGAVLQAKTRFELDMPAGGRAVVVAESRVTLDGFVLVGHVEIDGVLVFEKLWRK